MLAKISMCETKYINAKTHAKTYEDRRTDGRAEYKKKTESSPVYKMKWLRNVSISSNL